jgi:hypothetical protein
MTRLREEKRDYAEGGEWHDAFEGFLMLHNPAWLRRLHKARQEQLCCKTRSREEFKRDFTPAPSP